MRGDGSAAGGSGMDRRAFLETLAALALSPALGAAPPVRRRKKHWVWMTPRPGKTQDEWKRDFALMRSCGIDAVLAEVYDGRRAWYRSQRFPVKDALLERILPLAGAAGLEVHAWMWTMPCLLDDVVKRHPDWYNVNRNGESAAERPAYVGHYKFLDPARPEVRAFVRETVSELARIPGLRGIHLDYLRHPDAILPPGLWSKYGIVQDRVYPAYDYGYTAYSRRVFKARHRIDPLDIEDPERDRAWLRYRFDSLTELVNDHLVPAAHRHGKRISAAVFPGPSLARTMVRQDWARWKLDAFFPMLYHPFYEEGPEWVGKYAKEGAAAVERPVYAGLFAHRLPEAELIRAAEMALLGGADGVSIFEARSMDKAKWRALAGTLTAA